MINLVPIMLFSLSTTITPGPNNFMVMNSGLNFGVKKSLPHFFGVCLGFPFMLLLLATGMGTIFVKYHWIQEGLRIAGAAYMLYLAWQLLSPYMSKGNSKPVKPFSFIQALLFQWINPKAWMMAVSAISLFTITENYFLNAVTLCALFSLTCFASLAVWLFGGSLMQNLLKDEQKQKRFNLIMAILVVASIILIFVE